MRKITNEAGRWRADCLVGRVNGHAIGALVQANFSGTLTLGGTPLPGEPDDDEEAEQCLAEIRPR